MRPTRRSNTIVSFALALTLWLAAGVLLFAAGCIERKMVLRSEPPGAVAWIDDERVGVTPCETPFSHYGTRRVVLEYRREDFLKANGGAVPPGFEAGFRRVGADAPLVVPRYQWPVLDVVMEIVIPFTVTDAQEFVYVLEPAEPLPTGPGDRERLDRHRAAVLERAHALREHLRKVNEEERINQGLAEPKAAGAVAPK